MATKRRKRASEKPAPPEPTPQKAAVPEQEPSAENDWWTAPAAEPVAVAESEPPVVVRADRRMGTVPLTDWEGRPPMEVPQTTVVQPTPDTRPLRSSGGMIAAALRDVGRVRSVNQDSVYSLTMALPGDLDDIHMGIFVLADGMGGHEHGEVASRLAVQTVARFLLEHLVQPVLQGESPDALQPLLTDAVQSANHAVFHEGQRQRNDMGTTCTTALLLERTLFVAHVGDSRAYLLRGGELFPVTTDHSVVGRLLQLGHIDINDTAHHPLRGQLYRAIGQQGDIEVDFIYQPIGDATHILLCSDGLWGMLSDETIANVIQHNPLPQQAASELIALANAAGGDDNISVVVVGLVE